MAVMIFISHHYYNKLKDRERRISASTNELEQITQYLTVDLSRHGLTRKITHNNHHKDSDTAVLVDQFNQRDFFNSKSGIKERLPTPKRMLNDQKDDQLRSARRLRARSA